MTTFKEYLNEATLQSVKELIEKECKPFLDESGRKGFLIRGISETEDMKSYKAVDANGETVTYFKKRVRKHRRPLDTDEDDSKAMDKWFAQNVGFRARSEAVFAYGEKALKTSIGDLEMYGDVCVIFPIGPIEYTWSPNVEDLYAARLLRPASLMPIPEFLTKAKYIKTGMEKCVKLNHEVMIKCSSYLAFPLEFSGQLKKALGMK